MIPARQDFEADDLAGRQVHLRLEERHELAVLEAEADALLDLTLGDQRALHAGIEPDRPRRPARCLRMVERNVGTAQQVRNPRFRRHGRGDSGERADLDDPVVESERPGRPSSRTLGQRLIDFGAFVRTQARGRLRTRRRSSRAMTASSPSASVERRRNALEQPVTGLVAVLVVDRLEAMDLERDDDECSPRSARCAHSSPAASAKPLRLSRPGHRVGRREHGRPPLLLRAQFGLMLQVDVATPTEQDQRDVERQRRARDANFRVRTPLGEAQAG